MALFDTLEKMRGRVGVVVPVWFPEGTSEETRRGLLERTLQDSPHLLREEDVCLVNDGDERSVDVLECFGEDRGYTVIQSFPNRGKEFAVTEGMKSLLEREPALAHLAVRDADGDHFLEDLPQLWRTASHVERTLDTEKVLVVGRRSDLHRPMGWLRSELEVLQNTILLASLQRKAHLRGEELDLRFCSSYGDVPDFQSGYKLYTRKTAEDIFASSTPPAMGPLSGEEYWHYGTESVSVVEGWFRGATLAEMKRTSYWDQPVSGFGTFGKTQFYGCVMSWILWRMEISPELALQMIDNHVQRLRLWCSEEGRSLLKDIRQLVWERLGNQSPPPEVTGPAFL